MLVTSTDDGVDKKTVVGVGGAWHGGVGAHGEQARLCLLPVSLR